MKLYLRSLVCPNGGSNIPAVVFIVVKLGGCVSNFVKSSSQGKIAFKVLFRIAVCLARS